MRIMLIIPPSTYKKGEHYFLSFPVGTASLGAVLEKEGHNVKILDCNIEDPRPKDDEYGFMVGLEWEEIGKRFKEFDPDIIGISCYFTAQFSNVKKLSKILKRIKPSIKTFGGGASVEKGLEVGIIDYAVFGEGEETSKELMHALENNEPLDDIKGIGYKKDGKIIKNQKREWIKNLDNLPLPAYHLFPMWKYFKYGKKGIYNFYTKRNPFISVATSRGCPYDCCFCSVRSIWEYSFRTRSPEHVLKELDLLVKKYGVKEIQFIDDNLTLVKDRAMKIFQGIIDKRLDLSWSTPNGIMVKTLDEELIEKMAESGCYRVNLGIESGNQKVVDTIVRKPLNLDYCRKIIRILKKNKIKVTGFFVLGMIGETLRDMEDTIRFAKENPFDDVFFSIATPYPNTDFWDLAVKKGYLKRSNLNGLKGRFTSISTENFTAEQVEKMRNKAYVQFNFSKFKRDPITFITEKVNYINTIRRVRFFIYNKFLNGSDINLDKGKGILTSRKPSIYA